MPPSPRNPRHRLLDHVRSAEAGAAHIARRQYGISDESGTLRVGIGSLGAYEASFAGDYGVAVGDASGNLAELWPLRAETTSLAISTLGSWVQLTGVSGFPTITAYIGQTGRMIVGVSATAYCALSSAYIIGQACSGTLYLQAMVGGATPSVSYGQANLRSIGYPESAARQVVFDSLAPGDNTVDLWAYATSLSGPAYGFSGSVTLTAQAL